MEEYSYTSTHPLGHTGPLTGSLYLNLYLPEKLVVAQTFPTPYGNLFITFFAGVCHVYLILSQFSCEYV